MDSDQNKSAGKDPKTGRFLKGHKYAKGNPFAADVLRFRSAVYQAIKEGDMEAVTVKLIEEAKKGNVKAATLLYEITGLRIKQIEATVSHEEVTPEEARSRVSEFFGVN